MGQLQGLKEYLDTEYKKSIFDEAVASQTLYEMHLHGRVIQARVIENLIYDIRANIEGQGEEVLSKVQIKYLYPLEQAEAVRSLIKIDKKVKALNLEAIIDPRDRNFVKNKTLFPYMKDREVLFFTLLDGEIIRGLLVAFTRYDLTIALKGGVPVTVLRHSIHDVRDKKDRCLLKRVQEVQRDWEKSALYIADPPAQTG